MTGTMLRELLVLWPAYQELHGHLLSTDPRHSDPRDLAGPLCAYGHTKAACLLHAHCIGDSLADSADIARTLLAMAQTGRRPRFGRELGLSIEDFEGGAAA